MNPPKYTVIEYINGWRSVADRFLIAAQKAYSCSEVARVQPANKEPLLMMRLHTYCIGSSSEAL
jgi:hypothetical protein